MIARLVPLSLVVSTSLLARAIVPTLINGTPVPAGTWLEVVRITSNGGACTATIVGPRAIITAGHCADDGATANFTFKGKSYSAKMNRSPKYEAEDHDISVGIVSQDIAGAVPMTIGGTAALQTELTLLGYGCVASPGTGGNDGILRMGRSVVTGFSLPYDVVSRKPGGAALCFGDSGGPTFVKKQAGYLLLAINSKGNIKDTNYCTRLDLDESKNFVKSVATSNGVDICGINADCNGTPPPADPTCTLTANPGTVPVFGSLALSLSAQNATSADIDGTIVNVPNGEKRVTPSTAGNFTATGTVKNSAGKTGTCTASYTVTPGAPPPTKPSCTLTAVPGSALVDEAISIELQASGVVDFASIDGNPVAFPNGKLNVSRSNKGDYVAVGFVRGPGGSGGCEATYSVTEGVEPPRIAEFSITPTHCGSNRLPESGVKSACLAVIKRDNTWGQTTPAQVILLSYTNNTQEVLPLLAKKEIPPLVGSPQISDDLTVYANSLIKGQVVLSTKTAKLTRTKVGEVPLSIEGRSSNGRYFLVENLQPFDVQQHLVSLRTTK